MHLNPFSHTTSHSTPLRLLCLAGSFVAVFNLSLALEFCAHCILCCRSRSALARAGAPCCCCCVSPVPFVYSGVSAVVVALFLPLLCCCCLHVPAVVLFTVDFNWKAFSKLLARCSCSSRLCRQRSRAGQKAY